MASVWNANDLTTASSVGSPQAREPCAGTTANRDRKIILGRRVPKSDPALAEKRVGETPGRSHRAARKTTSR